MIETTNAPNMLNQKDIVLSQADRPIKQTMVDHVLRDITTMWKNAQRPCVLVRSHILSKGCKLT